MEIFKLIGSVMVDTAEAEKSLAKTEKAAEGVGNKWVDNAKKAGKWALATTGAAVAVGGTMVKLAKDTAADFDAIDKGSQRMKMGVESYQELAYAAQLTGVEMSTMEKAAKKLEGTDLSMEDALEQIWALGTAEERSAKAAELFGETVAYEMTPMLNASAKEMTDMKKEAHDLGLVMSEDAVKSGAEMGDMFEKISMSISALKNGIVAELMPYVNEILDWVLENIPVIHDTIHSVMEAILPIVKAVIEKIMEWLPKVMKAIQTLIDWLRPYIEPALEVISQAINAILDLLSGDIDAFADDIVAIFENLIPLLLNIGRAILTALWDGLVWVWENELKPWLEAIIDLITFQFDKIPEHLANIKWTIPLPGVMTIGGSDAIVAAAQERHGHGGKFAGGLPYVPYDNYPALLHQGESVMTAADSQSLLSEVRKISENSGGGEPITIVVQSILDGRIIGESVTRYQKNKARANA